MGLGTLFSAASVSGSGLAAERLRMETAANNIANSNVTRTAEGGAYRRQHVVFSTAMDQAAGSGSLNAQGLGGVVVSEVATDNAPLQKSHMPGHPDADENGMVEMPNVSLPMEMIDLMTASRAYEANLKALQTFRQMAEQALNLMRSTGS
jgi:flagellar basal-body rod protein FlgC